MNIINFIITITLLFFFTISNGQENSSKWRYEFGSGISLLGSGDVTAANFENSLNYQIVPMIETSVSIVYGRGIPNDHHFSSSYIHGNLNVLITPFRNKYKYSLKFGGGISYGNRNRVSASVLVWKDGEYIVEYLEDLAFKNYNELGYNLIIDNSYRLSNKYSIALKIFMQEYNTRETNFGTMLRIGYQL